MSVKLPQYCDFEIKFINLKQNIDPENIDLDNLQEIELVISQGNIKNAPILTLTYSDSPSSFTTDDADETIIVKLTSSQIGTVLGVYYFNLWLIQSGRRISHFTQKFVMVPAINLV